MLGSEGAPAQQCAGATRQEGEQGVGRSVSAGAHIRWSSEGEGAFLDRHVCVQVDVGGSYVGVAEP